MKKNKWISPLVLFASVALALSSCNKVEPVPEDKTPVIPEPSNISNEFSAEVDGDDFFELTFSGTKNDSMLLLSAGKSAGEAIGLTMPITIGVGTYTFDGIMGPKIGTYSSGTGQNSQYMVGMGTGELKIIFHDKVEDVIRGTFSYTATPVPGSTATDMHNITNGTFTYNY